MRLGKRLQQKLARHAPALFRLLAKTWRIRCHGPRPNAPGVLAFWHGDMLPVWYQFAHQNSHALVSLSRDGSLLTDLLESWGFHVIRGSSSKGGREALAEMADAATRHLLLVTPDGPLGPRHEMKAGALLAAHRAGVPLTLCRVSCRWAIHGTHWDQFLLPLPFAAIDLEFLPGPQAENDSRAEIDGACREAERRMAGAPD